MKKAYTKFYLITLGILLALSAYPLIMGIKILLLQWCYGHILPQDYTGYTIPYFAICLSILIVAALHPLLSRLKRLQTTAALLLCFGVFTGIELYMESITISSAAVDSVIKFQSTLCVFTPSARAAFQKTYTDAFKIHYFLIAFILIALIISLVYGYGALPESRARKRPLHLQLASAATLLGLSVFANFTGFFRQPVDVQPPVSALLTGLFFISLGAAAGIYIGSLLLGRNRFLSVWLPALLAMAVCAVMYYGESVMMGGALYRFGRGFFFEGLPVVGLAPFDVLVVLLSGAVTALSMGAAKKRTGSLAGSIADNRTL